MTTTNKQPRAEWLDAKGVAAVFSIHKSTLYRLAAQGKISSSSLRERGKKRGKRLFSAIAIEEFILRMATGGEEGAE